LFTIAYSGNIQTVDIFDFIHTEDRCDFKHTSVQIRIRLLDDWRQILHEAGFRDTRFFGDWDEAPYNKQSSRRLIAVAVK
jgi:hypothetical protein